MQRTSIALGAASLSAAALSAVAPTSASAAPTPAAPTAAAVKCSPGLGIGLAEEPRALVKDPRARTYVIDYVHPGTTFSRRVLVCNGDSTPMTIQVFGDGATIANGAFTLDQNTGQHPLSFWVSASPAQFVLPAHTGTYVEATLAVPRDASNGEYYGGVVAERPADAAKGVGVAARVGVRIYLEVGEGATAPASNFTVDTMTAGRAADGSPYVQALVHNTGGRAIDLSGALTLTHGPGGLSAGPFPAKLGTTLAPGQSEPVTVPLDKALPAGPWLARIVLRSDLLQRAAEATITFPTKADTTSPSVKAKSVPLTRDRGVVVPVAIGLILLALVLLALLWWRRRRRHHDDDDTPTSGTPVVPAPRAARTSARVHR